MQSQFIQGESIDHDHEGGESYGSVGTFVEYTIIITNNNSSDLTDFSIAYSNVNDVKISETESITKDGIIQAGETWTIVYQHTITEEDAKADNMTAVSSITIAGTTITASVIMDNGTTDTSDTIIYGKVEPSITLVKTADKTTFEVGDEIFYTFTIANTGNQTLYNVVLNDEQLKIENMVFIQPYDANANPRIKGLQVVQEGSTPGPDNFITYTHRKRKLDF